MQTNDERSGQTGATVRMTVQEAAASLGVTVEAVRGRMHRGKYGREQGPDGRVFVRVPADLLHEPERSTERSTERLGERLANDRSSVGAGPAEQVVERLLDEVAFLRAELAERSDALRRREVLHGEEIRRRDHIIAGLVERIPELGPAREPRNGHETATEAPKGAAEPRPATGGAQEGAERRSWWRRFFGF
jgi:hypothetical protein